VFLGYQRAIATRKSSKSKTDSRVVLFYTEVNNCKMSKTGNKLACGMSVLVVEEESDNLFTRFFSLSMCLVVEADEEVKESETSRGLSDEEKKERPSEIMTALEKGFSALANIVTEEVDK
jgi:hypothetical protein